MNKLIKFVAISGLGLIANIASADVYNYYNADVHDYCYNNPAQCSTGGYIKTEEFNITYDNVTQQMSFNTTVHDTKGWTPNQFALVVTNGEMPSKDGSYGILYGNKQTKDLFAYKYEGFNSANDSSNHIKTFDDVISSNVYDGHYSSPEGWSGDRTFTEFDFSVDLSYVNTVLTNDIEFGDEIGIWFFPMTNGTMTDYGNGQPIECFHKGDKGWFDTHLAQNTIGSNNPPSSVPEPAPLAMMVMGLGLIAYRRNRLSV